MYIANDNLVNSTTYEFDVFIVADKLRLLPGTYARCSWFFLDPAFRNGGTLHAFLRGGFVHVIADVYVYVEQHGNVNCALTSLT